MDWLRQLTGIVGYRHDPVTVQNDNLKLDQHLPMIHIVFGNLDAWLLGTHHGVSPKHLQGYLNEFVFRFNRRFWPMVAFDSVLKIAAKVCAPTCTKGRGITLEGGPREIEVPCSVTG